MTARANMPLKCSLLGLHLNSGRALIAFTLFLTSLLFQPETSAMIRCASHPLNKGDLSTFKREFRNALSGTPLLEQSDQIRTRDANGNKILLFHKETQYLFENKFFPRDIACIVTGDESPQSLINAGIWDTYSGTTVVLAPFHAEHVGDQFRSHNFDFVKHLATQVVKRIELTNHDCGDNNERHLSKYKNCIRDDLVSNARRGLKYDAVPNTSVVHQYNSIEPSDRLNAHIYEAFVASVAALEASNDAFYAKALPDLDNSDFKTYRIYDPITEEMRPVVSLVDFIGLDLVETSMTLLYERFFDLFDDLSTTGSAKIIALKDKDFVPADFWTFPYSTTMDQMKRVFVCSDGGDTGIRVSSLDIDSVLYHFRSVACPVTKYNGKQIIDLTVPLRREFELDVALEQISELEQRNTLARLLTELQAISLDQTVSIRGIQQYVTRSWFDQQIIRLQKEVHRLEANDEFDLEKLTTLADVVQGIVTGGTSFVTGMKGATTLLKMMPADDLPNAASFFWENRREFAKASKEIANGAGQVIRDAKTAKRIIEEEINEREAGERNIAQLLDTITKLSVQGTTIVGGIQEASARTESQWRNKLEEVYRAQAIEDTLGRNVSLLLEPVFAQNVLHGLTIQDVPASVEECVSSFRRFSETLENFNSLPISQQCGGTSRTINAIRNCLEQKDAVQHALLGIETSISLIVVGKNTHAVDCYRPRVGFHGIDDKRH